MDVMTKVGLVRLQLFKHHRDALCLCILDDLSDRIDADIHRFFNRKIPKSGTGIDEQAVCTEGQRIIHRCTEEIDGSLYGLLIGIGDTVRIGERLRGVDDESHPLIFRLLS